MHRRISRSENRLALYAQSTELNNGEFDTETTEENPKMLAFFDTLVQRDFSDSDSESTLSETESDDIDSVIAKKRNRIKARQSSQDSDYVQNTIQNAREVLMTTTEESETEEDLNSSSPLSKIDSDTEQAILDLEHSSSDNESTDDEEQVIDNVFKKSKNGKVRCYRKSNK